MRSPVVESLATAEILALARDLDGDLISCLIEHQDTVLTKNGRINKTAIARAMGITCLEVCKRLDKLKESLRELTA